ncbi:MAG: energy transducer TonB [Oculatellaceae cyanobacterium Prado106]|nr:energy transducer TonB [Oculatellaceae cyanobacterium Prado106]
MSSSVWVKSLPPVLQRMVQQPIAMSALISLALHFPLVLFLPRLFLSAPQLDEPEIQRPVDLVELTPAEQSRLPQLETSAIDLPPLIQTPSNLSPLPKPPSGSPTLPPLSGGFFSNPLSGGFFSNPLPPIPPSNFSFPPIGSSAPPVIRVAPTAPTVVPVPSTAPTVTPSPTPSAQELPLPSPVPTETPSPTPSPGSAVNGGTAPLPTPSTSPSPTDGQVATNPSPEATPEPENSSLVAQIRELRAKLSYNPKGTTSDEAYARMSEFSTETAAWLGEDRSINNSLKRGEMTGAYPESAGRVNPPLSGQVVVAVKVDGNGKVDPESEPEIIQSSGYGIFDEQAIAEVVAYPFEPTGQNEIYLIRVNYAPTEAQG